jgi:LAO/AO transport system kinase
MLELAGHLAWTPPIVRTVATTGDGVDELWDAVGRHRVHLEADGRLARRRRDRLAAELRAIVAERLARRADAICAGPDFDALVDAVAARTKDPYDAADALLADD